MVGASPEGPLSMGEQDAVSIEPSARLAGSLTGRKVYSKQESWSDVSFPQQLFPSSTTLEKGLVKL